VNRRLNNKRKTIKNQPHIAHWESFSNHQISFRKLPKCSWPTYLSEPGENQIAGQDLAGIGGKATDRRSGILARSSAKPKKIRSAKFLRAVLAGLG